MGTTPKRCGLDKGARWDWTNVAMRGVLQPFHRPFRVDVTSFEAPQRSGWPSRVLLRKDRMCVPSPPSTYRPIPSIHVPSRPICPRTAVPSIHVTHPPSLATSLARSLSLGRGCLKKPGRPETFGWGCCKMAGRPHTESFQRPPPRTRLAKPCFGLVLFRSRNRVLERPFWRQFDDLPTRVPHQAG